MRANQPFMMPAFSNLRPQHLIRLHAEPVFQDTGIDAAEVDGVFQVALLEVFRLG